MPSLDRFLNPDVERRLLIEQDEYIIDEVGKHWITVVRPVLVLVSCIPVFLSLAWWGRAWPIALLLGLAGLAWAVTTIHTEHMDRFVITNMRVFRVHGVFHQTLATTPLTRILDIRVTQGFWGQLLNYGDFVFESAAQDQGLREITFVARPDERDLTIERVIQAAGLRANLPRATFDDEVDIEDADDGT